MIFLAQSGALYRSTAAPTFSMIIVHAPAQHSLRIATTESMQLKAAHVNHATVNYLMTERTDVPDVHVYLSTTP